jgi:tetratricopeptide (TPR) repeat protein
MNVSFFGTDISTLKVEEKKQEPVEKEQEVTMKNTTQSSIDSNVPGFINTWQSWLKIDRTEEIVKEKAGIKEKAIETFIENNPRISQLKEESTYVVKEKNDDISHLMTETLANLYFEQKLYTKAIKAFEILIKKSPEKKEYFESKIQDIKDFRSKN